jgi:Tol biopolymer transport system component
MITVLNDKDGDFQVKVYRDRDIINVHILTIDQTRIIYREKYYFDTPKASEIYETEYTKTDAKKIVKRFLKSIQ